MTSEAKAKPRPRPPIATQAQLLTTADVCQVLRISRKSMRELVNDDPDFPKPFRITVAKPYAKMATGNRWSLGQIERYVAKKDKGAGNP